LTGSGAKNDRNQLAALTSVKARGGCEAVLAPHPVKMPSIDESSPYPDCAIFMIVGTVISTMKASHIPKDAASEYRMPRARS